MLLLPLKMIWILRWFMCWNFFFWTNVFRLAFIISSTWYCWIPCLSTEIRTIENYKPNRNVQEKHLQKGGRNYYPPELCVNSNKEEHIPHTILWIKCLILSLRSLWFVKQKRIFKNANRIPCCRELLRKHFLLQNQFYVHLKSLSLLLLLLIWCKNFQHF